PLPLCPPHTTPQLIPTLFHYTTILRSTAFVEQGCGRTESFDKLVDRKVKNPFDIEHILPDDFSSVADDFDNEADFNEWHNHIGSLLLLPADVNRSLQDKPYEKKVAHYGKQNFYAASLNGDTYEHQPQFRQFRESHELPFEQLLQFTKADQKKRQDLLAKLVEVIWSPNRLNELA
ncbi:MAG: HNH endonuclease family protein, partial [Planctomycetota bacterium]